MAYKTKFLHFKTKASYEAERAKTTEGSENRKIFDAYIAFIDEGPTICTWGKEYQCDSNLIVSLELTTSIEDYNIALEAFNSKKQVILIHPEELEYVYTSTRIYKEPKTNKIIIDYSLIYPTEKSDETYIGAFQLHIDPTGKKSENYVERVLAPATVAPLIAGTAAVGTSTKYAREDHRHPAQTTVSGNAGTATKLQTPRTIALTGAVSGSTTFDGSSNVSINSTLANIDASKITSGTLNADRLPEIPISKIPAAAMERLYVVESQSAAMSLTIQEGDVVQIGSGGPMYFCVSESASTFATKFKVFTAGAATSVPWSGVTNAPTKLSQFSNDAGYLTSVPAQTWASITGKPTFAAVATSGSYNDLTNKPTIPSAYTLPTASSTVLGGVKIGSGISISSGVISATYTSVGAAAASHTHTASQVTGLATVATSGSYNDLTNKPSIPSLSGYATQSWVTSQGYLTSIPAATSSAYGGIQIGYTTSGKNYAVQLSNGKAYVNVPWTDTNTNYYPTTFAWTNGTTAGPTGSLTGSEMSAVSFGAIPSASATQSGVVTTGDQTFGGIKTIDTINVTNINEATPGEGFWIGYNTEGVIRIGKDGDYDFGTNGGTYSGTANTAKRLLNSLQFSNGQSFNGSSAVTIDLPEIPIALPNPYALTINGTSYTGSSAVSISTSKPLSVRMLTSSTVDAGYSYSCGTSKAISTLNGFSSTNPDSVIISSAKLTFTASNVIKMDGLDDLSGTWYIYCLSYMANSKIAVNGAVYA